MITTTFDATLVDQYTNAFIDGNWFYISHFDVPSGSLVWLYSEHGVGSGYVSIVDVEQWEIEE